MAIIIKTNNPKALLDKIVKRISSKEINSWSFDEDGDLTCAKEGLESRAWFRPELNCRELVFNIIARKNEDVKVGVYASYHAEFTLLLLSMFDDDFYDISSTAKFACGDSP